MKRHQFRALGIVGWLVTGLGCVAMCAAAEESNRGTWPTNTPSPLSQFYVAPTRLVWKAGEGVENAENLLLKHRGQTVIAEPIAPCVLSSGANSPAGILLDFGKELQGYVEIFTPPPRKGKQPCRVHVRFGESVSEAMTDLGVRGAGNDHAIRDQVVTLPWMGKITLGPQRLPVRAHRRRARSAGFHHRGPGRCS